MSRTEYEKERFIVEKFALKSKKLLKDDPGKLRKVINLLKKHWAVLDSTGGMRVGNITTVEHHIELKDANMTYQAKPRPMNPIIKNR